MSRFTCDAELLSRHVEGRLSPREEQQLISHLEECTNCRERLETLAGEPHDWARVRNVLGGTRPVALDRACETQEIELPSAMDPALAFLAPTDDPAMLGRLGHYEVKGIVGRGGMGLVLKAYDRALDRTIAIKVLAPHLAATATARRRFAREAQAAAAVVHENVIPIYAVAESQGLPYLVMPYLGGCSLQQRLDRTGPLSPVETLRVARQVASGLAAAHAQGLVHRDVKPANILLENGVERVTITDFGLARAADDASLTRSGVVAGTPEYMAPEQARGESVDHRADLFSLGSVMYAMSLGHPPFRADSAVAVLRRVSDDRPRPIRENNPDVPPGLIRIIEKLHAKSPDDRFASAAELADLLERYLAHVQNPVNVPMPKELARRSLWTIPTTCAIRGFRRRDLKFSRRLAIAILLGISTAAAFAHWKLVRSQPGVTETDAISVTTAKDAELAIPSWDDGINERIQQLDADVQPLQRRAAQLWDGESHLKDETLR